MPFYAGKRKEEAFMKRTIWLFLIAVLAAGLMVSACAGPDKAVARKETPKVMASPTVVKLDGKSTVNFSGTGFIPGEEIHLTIVTTEGFMDLEIDSNPQKPVPDGKGAWATVWTLGGTAKFLKEGDLKVTVMGTDYAETLTHVMVTLKK